MGNLERASAHLNLEPAAPLRLNLELAAPLPSVGNLKLETIHYEQRYYNRHLPIASQPR